MKRRVLGIHHIGEKYKAVAARLKKEETKKGFSIDDFIAKEQAGEGGKSPRGGERSPRADKKEEPVVVPDEFDKPPPATANKTEDIGNESLSSVVVDSLVFISHKFLAHQIEISFHSPSLPHTNGSI